MHKLTLDNKMDTKEEEKENKIKIKKTKNILTTCDNILTGKVQKKIKIKEFPHPHYCVTSTECELSEGDHLKKKSLFSETSAPNKQSLSIEGADSIDNYLSKSVEPSETVTKRDIRPSSNTFYNKRKYYQPSYRYNNNYSPYYNNNRYFNRYYQRRYPIYNRYPRRFY